MFPYLISILGGVLIGNSLSVKKKFAKGGSVYKSLDEILPSDQIVRIIKSVEFKSFDVNSVKDIKYETETYNWFDEDFVAKIKAYPVIIVIRKNEGGNYNVRIGKSTGWVGGLMYDGAEYSYNINSLNLDEFEKGLEKAVKENIVTLYSQYASGALEKIYFVGNEKDAEKFAISRGYEKQKATGAFDYYYYNDKLSKWNGSRLLKVARFDENFIKQEKA